MRLCIKFINEFNDFKNNFKLKKYNNDYKK